MSVFYKVRVKVSAPTFKTKFIDGLFIAKDVLDDTTPAKNYIIQRTQRNMDEVKIPDAKVEVVLFRRSNFGFILHPTPTELKA